MMLVGLTGGVATGKSTVARLFQECGAVVIDADALARQVVQRGKPAWRDIVRTFGSRVLAADGAVDRQRLGHLVFTHPQKLAVLNALIHPRVAREQARLARDITRRDPDAVIIYDIPLLFEAGVDARVDRIVVVAADRHTQLRRLQERNGLSRTDALRRIRAQLPLAHKVKQADYLLDGTLPLTVLRRQVKTIYGELREQAKLRSRGKVIPRRRSRKPLPAT